MKLIMENWRTYLNEEELLANSIEINKAIIESNFFSEEELLTEGIAFSNLLQNVYKKVYVYAVDIANLSQDGQLKHDVKELSKNAFMNLKGKSALFVLKGLDLIVRLANIKKAGLKFDFKTIMKALKKCAIPGSKYFCRHMDELKSIVKDNPNKTIGEITQESCDEENTETSPDPGWRRDSRCVSSGGISRPLAAVIMERIVPYLIESFEVIKGVFKFARAIEEPSEFASELAADILSNNPNPS